MLNQVFGIALMVCLSLMSGCAGPTLSAASSSEPLSSSSPCEFPVEPTVVRQDGNALLQYWEFDSIDVLFEPVLPVDSGYAAYREHFEAIGAAVMKPIPIAREATDDKASTKATET